MNLQQWDTFVRMVGDGELHANQAFDNWLWEGTGPTDWALRQDVEVIAMGGWTAFYNKGWSRYWAREAATNVAQQLQAPFMRAVVIREVQRRLQEEVIDRVNREADPALRGERIDWLRSPEYIFREVARMVGTEQYSRLLQDALKRTPPSFTPV